MAADPQLLNSLFNQVFDYAGVGVFAATGAIAAARKRQDALTFVFFAMVAGVGGGTLRDLLLDLPVFWVAQPLYLMVCIATALAIWMWAPPPGTGVLFKGLLWLDALGVSAYAILGTHKALAAEAPALVAVVMGTLTATFGGILRDLLGGEPSILLRREVYVTAAITGASLFAVLRELQFDLSLSAAAGVFLAFAIRAGALVFGWSLPAFHRKEGS